MGLFGPEYSLSSMRVGTGQMVGFEFGQKVGIKYVEYERGGWVIE